MDARTWQQAKEWLVEAAALPESERAAYLGQHCQDAALLAELLEMLAEDQALTGIVRISPLTPGTRLGPYEIVSSIGAGGMGEVYRARDGRLGRDVAVKVISAPFTTDRDRLARFEREAKLLASLNHPHICTLFDVGRSADTSTDYIVMELVDGELLSDRLRSGPLPVDKALTYAIEIADALEKAHALGIVHRDLKPANVMLTKSGTKLLDFGLARNTRTPSDNVTKTGTILGTLRYMAPEQLRGGEADSRSDVWAFGCVLYQMLAGRAPFDSPSEAATGAAILETEPPPLSSMVPGISPLLERVVDRCLAKAPDDRWQSVADLRHELVWITKSSGKANQRVLPKAQSSSRERLAWGIAGAAIVLAIAGVAAARWSGRPVPAPVQRWSMALPPGIELARFMTLSNDGRRLAFVGRPADGGPSLIWVQTMGDVDARQLTGTTGNPIFPFWSPSGSELGFFADGRLKVIDVASGAMRELCAAKEGRGGTWAGRTILFVPEQHAAVHRVSDQGGEPVAVTQRQQPNELHRFPRFLADGIHFLFIRVLEGDGHVTINTGSINDATITSLDEGVKSTNRPAGVATTQAYVVGGTLLYARAGHVLAQPLDATGQRLLGEPIIIVSEDIEYDLSSGAFAASDNAIVYRRFVRTQSQLTWLPRSGARGTPVSTPGVFQMVELSNEHNRAIVARSDGTKLIYSIIPVDRPNAIEQLGEGSSSPVLWSRDGTRVLFRKPSQLFKNDIYSVLVDGRGDERLVVDRPTGNKLPLGWSPTGALLYAVNVEGTGSDLWEQPATGEPRLLIPASATADFVDASVAPGGELIASAVKDALYLQRIYRGGRITVDTGKVSRPRWRADGRELYYLSGGSLMAVDVDPVPLRVGTPRRLFDFNGQFYAPSADGQRFLAAVPQASAPLNEIPVILNWTGLVKQATPR